MSAPGLDKLAPADPERALTDVAAGPAGRGRRAVRDVLWRYCVTLAGPIGSAVAQFGLSIVLLRTLSPNAFGAFSILLIASQFSTGVISALFCAPLPVLMAIDDSTLRARTLESLFASNRLVALLTVVVFAVFGRALDIEWGAALLFAAYAGVASLRWFARAYAYASEHALRTTASDVVYAGVLAAGVAYVALVPGAGLRAAFGALLVSAAAGMAPFGRSYLRTQFSRIRMAHLKAYRNVWREHSGWSLLGVLTTEATGNAHAYIVTLVMGAGALAPLAASALLIRPIAVVTNALSEFERARVARQIGDGDSAGSLSSLRGFRLALFAAWVGTVAVAVAVLALHPRLLFPPQYELNVLILGAGLWIAVGGVRALRQPDSVLLQAVGQFRLLALASVYSGVVSVLAVAVLVSVRGALWSIAGVLFGEALFAAWTWRRARAWKADRLASKRLNRAGAAAGPQEKK